MIIALTAISPTDAFETRQTSKNHCEVQKIEKLEQEIAELQTRTRDLRVQVQDQKSTISQLDLKTADTSCHIDILEKEIQA
ncbi:hypothetical protein LIER_05327 [Lithospermum erythrorhizon]|uniref:Uncharacterized protein n=1 Tax=Lithospermum erythrorhizon TaxID=34254 RepID=A0AAV3P036_LITER